MTETGFVKAQSDNLPKINAFMMTAYFASNPDFTSAEIKGVKTAKAEEPAVIQIFRLIFETLKVLILLQYEILKAIFYFFISPAPKDVADEIVLITGAGHGMGREMALRFARLGAIVICVDINETSNKDTLLMIKEEKGRAYKYECDVRKREAVFALAEQIRKDVGDVTILVNNAGIMPCKPFLRQSEQEITTMMDLNVNAYLWTIQAFLPSMIEKNYGHIVSMSSMAGLLGIRNLVPYCASKYAVRGLMHALTVELHDDPRDTNGINLTTVYPYIVDTGLCQKPRIKFKSLLKVISPGEAADTIVDAVRRNYNEICTPTHMYYSNKFLTGLLPVGALLVLNDYLDTGVDSHE